MTSFQKIIKYGAIVFAIYLCFLIIRMIVFGITAIFGITVGFEMFENSRPNTAMVAKWEQEYENIKKIDIDLNVCKLKIKKGNKLRVEASEVSNQLECQAQNNTLKIKDENVPKHFFNTGNIKSEVIIYMPEDIQWENMTIETGINETEIEFLRADNLKIQMGVGRCQIDSIFAKDVKIEAGAGETIINNGQIERLKLEGGMGRFIFTSYIEKDAKIDCGVGKMELNLIGLPTDYKIEAESGLGNFLVDNQKITGSQKLGDGKATIDIDAGVGETVVNFIEKSLDFSV